jgi:S-DNA-T family DNA segregation ATPase FtsK/SpoIIIE
MAKRKTRKKRKTKKELEEIKGDGEDFISLDISGDAKRSIIAIFLVVLAIIFTLGFFDAAGIAGDKLTHLVGIIFGWGKFIMPLVLLMLAIILIRKKSTFFYISKSFGILVVFFSVLSLFHLLSFPVEDFVKMADSGAGGGYSGYLIANLLTAATGKIASTLILMATLLVGLIIAFNFSFTDIQKKLPQQKNDKFLGIFSKQKKLKNNLEEEPDEFEEQEEDVLAINNKDIDIKNNKKLLKEDQIISDSNVINSQKNKAEEKDVFGGDTDFDDDLPKVETKIIPEIKIDKIEEVVDKNIPQKSEIENQVEVENENNQSKNIPKKWQFPPLSLLEKSKGSARGGDVNKNAEIIKETLSNFGIKVELDDIITGPTVTRYSFRPPSGVKLSKITSLNADLALALAAHPIRIEAPIPGKSLVGIEVPNRATVAVRMQELVKSPLFKNEKDKLLLALGKDVNGEFIISNLAKMPHLLVAGATGAGKSVTINSILISLLYKNSPLDLKLILVDPKRVELSLYNGIPHLLANVIVDNNKVLNALKWAISEMDRRYKLLEETGSRDIGSYNQKRKAGNKRIYTDPETGREVEEEMENLPMIVIVMDELADLMVSHGKEVEGSIVRLAQMSRAIGIHLIVSTQRPSVEVITGLIKANLPSRIALRVSNGIDSRTIIDNVGAEKLVGQGDMLLVGPNSASAQRLQGVYIDENEVKRIVDFIKQQKDFIMDDIDLDEILENDDSKNGVVKTSQGIASVDFDQAPAEAIDEASNPEKEEALYPKAKEIVIKAGKASTSYLQRTLRVGYARAARLIDLLEENGVVGPAQGSKARTILVNSDNENNNEENNLTNNVTGENAAIKNNSQEVNYEKPENDQMKRDNWQV